MTEFGLKPHIMLYNVLFCIINSTSPNCIGAVRKYPVVRRKGKWKVSYEEWPETTFAPRACPGVGYMFSGDAVPKLLSTIPKVFHFTTPPPYAHQLVFISQYKLSKFCYNILPQYYNTKTVILQVS